MPSARDGANELGRETGSVSSRRGWATRFTQYTDAVCIPTQFVRYWAALCRANWVEIANVALEALRPLMLLFDLEPLVTFFKGISALLCLNNNACSALWDCSSHEFTEFLNASVTFSQPALGSLNQIRFCAAAGRSSKVQRKRSSFNEKLRFLAPRLPKHELLVLPQSSISARRKSQASS